MKYNVFNMPKRLVFDNVKETSENIKTVMQTAPNCVVLDFGNCEHMDSSGLGLLVHTTTTQEKDVRVIRLNDKLRKVLRITQVDQILPIFNTLEGAVNAG